ncbi:polysaccharide biosynthesis/export family protein [Rhodobacter sp. Har01]|uniref:polysaccharide biosynthesis/export family protein n=1 Tax=Rhodobacter sp. Har01 TaxID=2883999 RepID=UPI001D0742B6|nr:polysaccharide biosynthesis/export family protein [Rhodobacter sp. Har01]MCB6180109.1 polysaccharide biosynthesis/export family protein [Rhodobacter sp. Har01]
MRQLIFMVIGLVLGAVPAFAQDGYRIKPGDVLSVEVLEDSNLNRSVLVLPDGRISLPMAGTVVAGGRTIEQVQAEITQKLGPNFASAPNVYVGINTLAAPPAAVARGPAVAPTIDVYVMGEAAKPGKYAVTPGTTLLQFLAETGGFSKFAATKRIQLRRVDAAGGERVYTIDYRALESGGASGGSTIMADGDVIIVPQRRLFE